MLLICASAKSRSEPQSIPSPAAIAISRLDGAAADQSDPQHGPRKHAELTETKGKVTANHVMRDFRAAYNLALRVVDKPDLLPDNPVKAVTFNKERRQQSPSSCPDDLPDWWEKIQALPNPLRRDHARAGTVLGPAPRHARVAAS